jgi:hypothetical protein
VGPRPAQTALRGGKEHAIIVAKHRGPRLLAEDAGILCEAPDQDHCDCQLSSGRLLPLRLFQHYSVM